MIVLAALASFACSDRCVAAEQAVWGERMAPLQVGWWAAPYVPPRFRNHCRFDATHGYYYCSDHCGSDYQFYYCSNRSFGCCHIGVGYCDYEGLLRCRP
jgi:hypothetical protein